MTSHPATCRCGQLTATATGEPVRVSVCHCLNCQKRSGSAFAAQVRFPAANVTTAGNAKTYTATGDNGAAHFHFCPDCGSTVTFTNDSVPDTIAIAWRVRRSLFLHPQYSGGNSQHEWLELAGERSHGHNPPSRREREGSTLRRRAGEGLFPLPVHRP